MGILSRIAESYQALAGGEAETGIQALGLVPYQSTFSNPQPWLAETFGAGPTATGKAVTNHSAARFTAVSACVQVLEQAVGQIPCELMRSTKDGGAQPADDHPLYELVKNAPNGQMTGQETREMAMNHLCYQGTAYHQIVRGGGAQVVAIMPLMPEWITVRWGVDGTLEYDYRQPGKEMRTLQQAEVWRIIGRTRNGITGISPISENREAIGLGMAAEEHGAKLFANGAQIATAFEHPAKMSNEAYLRLKGSLDDRYAGSRNAFKTIVLEEGMKVSKLAMSNVDSQFIEARKFQIEEICRIFCVPPHKIQHLDRATFNNIEHLTMDFVNSSLMPWLVRFESTMYRDLLLPNERKRLFFRFDTSSLLRADSVARANLYASAITNRWMNPNEARVREGLNPYLGGDEYANPNTTSNVKPGAPEPDPARG